MENLIKAGLENYEAVNIYHLNNYVHADTKDVKIDIMDKSLIIRVNFNKNNIHLEHLYIIPLDKAYIHFYRNKKLGDTDVGSTSEKVSKSPD